MVVHEFNDHVSGLIDGYMLRRAMLTNHRQHCHRRSFPDAPNVGRAFKLSAMS
jgi:hypothetical protein